MTDIADVASVAGVSPIVVRMALMSECCETIEPALLDHVRDVALSHGMRPIVSEPATQRILIVLPEHYAISSGSQYFARVLDGALRAAFERDYMVALKRCTPETDLRALANEGSLRGVIWTLLGPFAHGARVFHDAGLPVVVLHGDAESAPAGVRCVGCDNVQGIDLAVRHLVELGHCNIAFVTYGHLNYREFLHRERALFDSLESRGFEPYPTIRYEPGHGKQIWRSHVDRGLSAVIVVSEVLAGIVLREAAQERLWLPDQLSVVGFDSTAFCESTVPRLTAISQPLAAMAYDAVACLIDDRAMFAKGDIVSRVFPCGLDVRDSTGPPVA